jgi:hypothetical protein
MRLHERSIKIAFDELSGDFLDADKNQFRFETDC